MKIILPLVNFTFTPSLNQVDFLGVSGFDNSRLYAVINVTTGKLVYAVASATAGFGGTFSGTVLTYASSNVGQTNTDVLQCIYDDPTANQNVSGSVSVSGNVNINDGNGNVIGSVIDPLTGDFRLFTQSSVQAGDGTPILSTYDPINGEDGLNVNLLNSSFGGQLGSALPIPNNNNALSMAFLNGSVLSAPRMDPVTNELIVQSSPAPMQNVNIAEVNGSAISGSKVPVTVDGFGGSSVTLGQNTLANSLPVAIASDQNLEVSVGQTVSQDILGVAVGGNRNNQIEVSFNAAPGATLITNTFTGAGSVSITQGHSVYQTGSVGAAASAQAVSVQTTVYRPAHEIYCAFTAAFTNMILTRSDAKIGLFDATNGFFVGYDITQGFAVGVRSAGVDTITPRGSWNVDDLTGAGNSKFTRNGVPEAIDFGLSNLFRIRFAWLGSANIFFEVFSPDAEWVLFHNIRQPNSNFLPSIENPNLPMTVRVSKTSGTQNSQVATACWGAGTTSAYSPITATLNDNTLAAMTRSVITGVTTGGGGGYVNVKVNPSGALVTESTISGTAATNITQYGGTGTTLGQKASSASMPVVIASDQSNVNSILPDLYITGAPNSSAGNNNLLAVAGPGELDVSGYKSAAVQVISGATSGTFIFEGSNSTTSATFQAIPAFRLDSASPNAILTAITATSSNFIYIIPIRYRYMRMRVVTDLSTTVTALTRLSQDPYVSPISQVINATAANLNATVAGTVTVTQPTPANLNVTALVAGATLSSASVADITNATQTTSQTSPNISTLNTMAATFQVTTTATAFNAGTVLDVVVEETLDGTNYYTLYAFERISTTNAIVRSPVIKLSGTGIRYIRTISGGTPSSSIQNAVTRISRAGQAETIRRFIDRTIVPNTLNSTTASFFCDGVEDFNLIVRCTAQTTAATIALEFSSDNTNWFTSSTTITTVVGVAQAKIDNMQFKYVRATVTAAGTGITLGEVVIGGHSA